MYHSTGQEDIWKHTTETVFGNLCRPVSVSNKSSSSTTDRAKVRYFSDLNILIIFAADIQTIIDMTE